MRHIYLWAVESKGLWRSPSAYLSEHLIPKVLYGTQRGAQRHLEALVEEGEGGALRRFLVLELPSDAALSDEALAVLKDYAIALAK